ncbi:tripartite tricarboxylate transporter permease [Shumkonia mesophila]|uniref:tripartite tricarboxylate transporter permease n=1 Tax=Shumkonia mesophila TaxID=2838854 RepID=UPI0029347A42|nr:tripartite tricarboxylate transporter permease [Shumkonia mesophila]
MAILTDPFSLFVIFAGTLGGVMIGALPGLSSTMAVALLLPFTVSMDVIPAIAMLSALYCAGTYGGAITAILINSPGTPAACATSFDGYPMAEQGQAGRALGMAVWSSFVGGTFSVFALLLAAPALARLAYNFGAPEYFALALFGMSMLAAISGESAVKNLIGGAFGLLIATVGVDFTTGVERFTFGFPELLDGIDFIPVMIGIFGISELLTQANVLDRVYRRLAAEAVKLPSLEDFRKVWKTMIRSSFIGTFIGVLPAEGGTVASMIGYNEAKRWSKEPEKFGHGAIEGVAGPETANNAATGGAMVPTLALGIPGSATTAVIMGALMVHGLRPGPHLFIEQPHFLYAIFTAMMVANFLFLGIGIVGAKLFARITLIPNTFLWPAVFVLAMVGAYSLEQNVVDIYVMLAFGLIGYVGRRHGFSPAPIIMGLVLGELMENTLKQSLIIFDHNWLRFFERPIVDVFFVLTIIGLFSPLLFKMFQSRK